MAHFDYKKYLAKNPLTEAYTPGSGWTQDFDYDDMLAHGLKLNADSSIEDLEKVFADFEDVNYHREAEPLSYAIDAIKAGDRGEAKMYINKFHKELKKTIADYSDEYFDVSEEKLHENMFDVAATEKIAQSIADTFTAEDNELDLKYVVNPRIDSGSFDLDVEAGPNTPGEDWKDVNGFGIDNYLGDFAGGSFYIKDGVVYNAAMRNAPVANVSAKGEVEMISAEDSRAAIGMEENKKETKSNKMKKSELKEMIKMAMMAEIDGSAVEAEDYDPVAEEYGKEFKDALRKRAEEEDLEAATDRIDKEPDVYPGKKTLDPDYVKEADEEVEDEETVDVAVGDTETIDTETTAEIDPNVKTAQDALTQAMEAARQLGDKKLQDQIGNTITFFTRAHVANTETGAMAEADEMEEGKKEYYKDAEADDAEHIKALEKDMKDDKESSLKLGEVMFPMWTKIQK